MTLGLTGQLLLGAMGIMTLAVVVPRFKESGANVGQAFRSATSVLGETKPAPDPRPSDGFSGPRRDDGFTIRPTATRRGR